MYVTDELSCTHLRALDLAQDDCCKKCHEDAEVGLLPLIADRLADGREIRVCCRVHLGLRNRGLLSGNR